MLRRTFVLSIVLLAMLPIQLLLAEKSEAPSKGFSIEPAQDWIELPPPFQDVVASYAKKGTLATFHITERNLDEVKSIEQLKWEDLFSPEFKSIDIRTQNVTLLGGEKAKFCVLKMASGI